MVEGVSLMSECRVAWRKEPPETWGDWHDLIRSKWVRWRESGFPDTDPMTAEEMRILLFRIEREHAGTVTEIVEKFALTGRWPWGSREQAYFLARRIEYAMEILSAIGLIVFEHDNSHDPPRIVNHMPVPLPTARPGIIVSWLLRDCWEMCGRDRWIDRFILARSR